MGEIWRERLNFFQNAFFEMACLAFGQRYGTICGDQLTSFPLGRVLFDILQANNVGAMAAEKHCRIQLHLNVLHFANAGYRCWRRGYKYLYSFIVGFDADNIFETNELNPIGGFEM